MRKTIRYSFLVAGVVGLLTLAVGVASALDLNYVSLLEELFLWSGAIIALLLRGDNYDNELHVLSYAIPSAIIINAIIAFLLGLFIGCVFSNT